MTGWIKEVAMFIVAVLVAFGMGFSHGTKHERGVIAEEHVAELKRVAKERDDVQEELNATARNWAKDQARSESLASSTADRLAQSDVRLRVKLADSKVAEVQGYNRGLADGKAELHRETAEALIRITQDADRHVTALQDSLKEVTREAGQ